jgi:hypothetical protein
LMLNILSLSRAGNMASNHMQSLQHADQARQMPSDQVPRRARQPLTDYLQPPRQPLLAVGAEVLGESSLGLE